MPEVVLTGKRCSSRFPLPSFSRVMGSDMSIEESERGRASFLRSPSAGLAVARPQVLSFRTPHDKHLSRADQEMTPDPFCSTQSPTRQSSESLSPCCTRSRRARLYHPRHLAGQPVKNYSCGGLLIMPCPAVTNGLSSCEPYNIVLQAATTAVFRIPPGSRSLPRSVLSQTRQPQDDCRYPDRAERCESESRKDSRYLFLFERFG